MMFLMFLVGVGAFAVLSWRIRQLEAIIGNLQSDLAALLRHPPAPIEMPEAKPEPEPATADENQVIAQAEVPRLALVRSFARESPHADTAEPSPAISLETLIGGRLPIWIGGVALILAGFFLVRYSIERGLLGPGTRTLLALLFGLALVAGSEVTRRIAATRDDPRVAQALAGAGIASLYGTLYMAAALYHLVAPLPAFGAVLAVTALAIGLALLHGPPTAIMALAGGFAAPMVAGFDSAGIVPLLVYLALFITVLFGLAIHRGWGWLAIAASVAGFGWTQFLIAMLDGRAELPAVGAFTLLLALGTAIALPSAGLHQRWARIAPIVVGLIQLLLLAPALHFDALAWSYYLLLAAGALALAWRAPLYLPAAVAALGLLLVLEAVALLQPEHRITPMASVVATLLFALPGHLRAARDQRWAAIALAGTAGPLLIAHGFAPGLLPAIGWGFAECIAAAACGAVAWRWRGKEDTPALTGATLLTAAIAALGLAQFVPNDWLSLPLTAVLAGLALWARQIRAPQLFALPILPLLATLAVGATPLGAIASMVGNSLIGERLPWLALPPIGVLLRCFAVPLIITLLVLRDRSQFGPARAAAATLAAGLALVLLYAGAKQILAIGTAERFVHWGFFERALLTQGYIAAGWLLLRRGRAQTIGRALMLLGLARLAWFDLLLLNPAWVAQWVGPLPLFNLATLHLGLAAFWLWTLPPARPVRVAAAALTLVATMAAVREAAQGPILTGPIGRPENIGYSAALLGVALVWLWRGIRTGAHDLRVAGLALLTLTTLKVFLVDAAALDGILRILSFLGLGIALIAIGWAYSRFLGRDAATG